MTFEKCSTMVPAWHSSLPEWAVVQVQVPHLSLHASPKRWTFKSPLDFKVAKLLHELVDIAHFIHHQAVVAILSTREILENIHNQANGHPTTVDETPKEDIQGTIVFA